MSPHRRNPPMQEARTHCLIWFAAIICTILTVIVIIGGIVIFISYIAYRPKIPYVSVIYAHLDSFDLDQTGILHTRLTILIKAQNDNAKAHASFYSFNYSLNFHTIQIADLVNSPFDIGNNESKVFHYLAASNYIPLDPQQMDEADRSLKENRVMFHLYGHTRTRWRVGPLRSVKFWLRLDCWLQFQWPGGDSVGSHCTSKAK